MLKKTKLYLLLFIIVLSTAIGLFNLSQTTLAQSAGAKWEQQEGENTPTIIYNGEAYTLMNGPLSDDDKNLYFKDDSCKAGGCSDDDKINSFYFTNDDVKKNIYVFCKNAAAAACGSDGYIIVMADSKLPNPITGQSYGGTLAKFEKNGNEYYLTGQTTQITISGVATDDDIDQAEDNINPSTDDGDSKVEASSCPIDGIGWLICPVVSFVAKVTDKSYDLLEGTLLRVEPLGLPGLTTGNTACPSTTDSNKEQEDPAAADTAKEQESCDNTAERLQLYESWKLMRNFANVVFIILFLVIILSQTTNIGISNYGIKRLLPKIIIAAILVNLSYYICAIAIDVANILGNTLREALMSLRVNKDATLHFHYQYTIEGDAGASPEVHEATGEGWEGLARLIVVGVEGVVVVGLIYAFLPVFLPVIFSAMIAVITVVITLTLRQALIILLVVISPLAFVALLLPNTEGYFHKWRSLFTAMLMVYPIISIIFGASALAADILMKSPDFMVQMVGAGVSVIPLFITPIVMKVSGGLLNRWVGLVNNPNRGPIDAMRKGVERKSKKIDDGRKIESFNGGGRRFGGFRYRGGAKKDAVNSSLDRLAKQEENSFIAKEIGKNTNFQAAMAGEVIVPKVGGQTIPNFVPVVGGKTIPQAGGQVIKEAAPGNMTAVQASAVAAQKAEAAKDITNMESLIRARYNNDLKEFGGVLEKAIASGDAREAIAAQNLLFNSGSSGLDQYRKSMENLATSNPAAVGSEAMKDVRRSITQDHSDMKNKANDIADFGLASESSTTLSSHTNDAATWQKMSARQTSTQADSSLQAALDLERAGTPAFARPVLHQVITVPELAVNIKGPTLRDLGAAESGGPILPKGTPL